MPATRVAASGPGSFAAAAAADGGDQLIGRQVRADDDVHRIDARRGDVELGHWWLVQPVIADIADDADEGAVAHQRDDGVAGGSQVLSERRSDEAGGTGDEDTHSHTL